MGAHQMLYTSPFFGQNITEKIVKRRVNFSFCPKAAQKLQGKVTSIGMDKTVTVTVNRLLEHIIYKKRSKLSKTYLAHSEDVLCDLGDEVELQPCRPISKRKQFFVKRIARKNYFLLQN